MTEGWHTRLEERDGELVPVPFYHKRTDWESDGFSDGDDADSWEDDE